MKKIFYFTILVALMFLMGSCHRDRGNYDYYDMADVTVDATSGIYTYNVVLGQLLNIPMTVAVAGISESELSFQWEIQDAVANNTFRIIEDKVSRDFDRTIGPDDYFDTYTTFRIRLVVSWEEKGRTRRAFSRLFEINASGETGLLVLHGDDNFSDIAMIINNMFTVSAGTQVAQERIIFDMWSSANGGRIPGRGVMVQQQRAWSIADSWIYVWTDQVQWHAAATNFVKLGSYEDLFFAEDGVAFFQGRPESIQIFGMERVIIDGGDLFWLTGASAHRFGVPQVFANLPDYRMSKHSYFNHLSAIGFCDRRAFVVISFGAGTPVAFRHSTYGPFNLNDMQADLLHMDRGGIVTANQNFLAVFREDNGTKFIGEMRFDGGNAPGDTWARFRYEVDGLPGFNEARFYALGGLSNTMNYYVTGENSLYQFFVAGTSGIGAAQRLLMDGVPLEFTGEITMMKILRPRLQTAATLYQFHGRKMLVGTYENGVGTLHAILLNELDGQALQRTKFTGFGRITDANLKPF